MKRHRWYQRAAASGLFYGLWEFAWWLLCRTHWVHIPDRPSDAWCEL